MKTNNTSKEILKIKAIGKARDIKELVCCHLERVAAANFHLTERLAGTELVMEGIGSPLETESAAHFEGKKFLHCHAEGRQDGQRTFASHIDIPISKAKDDNGEALVTVRIPSRHFEALRRTLDAAQQMHAANKKKA